MRRTSKIILITIIATSILLGLGYAAIQNITLNITGTAVGQVNQDNFKIRFIGTPVVSDVVKVTANIDSVNPINANINVAGLSQKGEKVTATYEVINESEDLSADLNIASSNSNTEYFSVSSKISDTSLKAGDKTTVLVTVELIKTPLNESVSANIAVGLTGISIEPGKEGSSGLTNDFSQTPEKEVISNANIGDYIDLNSNIVGSSATTDDWRVLLVDEENTYVILSDYLPNSTNYAVNAGLRTMGTYGVYSNIDREDFLTKVYDHSNWNDFTNGIDGAVAFGAATSELYISSYYTKYGILIDPDDSVNLDLTLPGHDLYIVNNNVEDDCRGVWVASEYIYNDSQVYCIYHYGKAWQEGYDYPYLALRPVVAIPKSIEIEKNGNIWKVANIETNGKTNLGVERKEALTTTNTILSSITNENIGDYIDLGTNYVGSESTTDDWRILFKDEEATYIILADYLPVDKIPNYDKFETDVSKYPYCVWSLNSSTEFVNDLLDVEAWKMLNSDITESIAIGTPVPEILRVSYNYKYNADINFTSLEEIELSYLYVPRSLSEDGTLGYWIANSNSSASAWGISYNGKIGYAPCDEIGGALRPVVIIENDYECTYTSDGLWTLITE